MKTATHRTDVKMHKPLRYPNAATKEALLHKLLDNLLTAAIGAAAAAILTFLIVLA